MQDAEYLAAHKIMQNQEQEIARLQAQIEALQGDVSRLTIENGLMNEALSLFKQADSFHEPLNIPLQDAYNQMKISAQPDDKPTKKRNAST